MVAAWSAPLGAPQIGAPQHDSEEEKDVEAGIANGEGKTKNGS